MAVLLFVMYEEEWKPTRCFTAPAAALVAQNYISSPLQQTQPVFTIKRMMYETETTSQQPINQLQTNDDHSGPKPYWLMTDAMWSGRGSREHNKHLIVAVLQSECTNLMSLMLTNGKETAVMNAPEGGSV